MTVLKLIEAVKTGNIDAVKTLLHLGENIEQKDEYGWTALNWAAGKGYTDIIGYLLEVGADIANVGRDKRTAFEIALAAAYVESARLLQQATQKNAPTRLYCKAYFVAEIKKFPDWSTHSPDLTDDTVVFLHQNYCVTRSILPDKEVIFDSKSSAWQDFCANQLSFSVPDDIELATAFTVSRSSETNQQFQ